MMVITHSKLTENGQAIIPAEVIERLGIGPGAVLEWEAEGENIMVRRATLYSSEDIHRALFPVPPQQHSLEELKEGIQRNLKERYARDRH